MKVNKMNIEKKGDGMDCNYCDRIDIEEHNEDFYLLDGKLYINYIKGSEIICLDCANKKGLEVTV